MIQQIRLDGIFQPYISERNQHIRAIALRKSSIEIQQSSQRLRAQVATLYIYPSDQSNEASTIIIRVLLSIALRAMFKVYLIICPYSLIDKINSFYLLSV